MKPQYKQLKNGLNMIVVPMKDNPTVTVLTLVATGSKYETKENNGISHFLEHMCFKGTTKRPHGIDISRELDGLGAESNAFTGQEYTGYWAKGRAKHTGKLLDVVADVYLNSTFPDIEMQKEKGVILDEINMYEDLPMRKVHNVLGQLLYGDQPAGWTILGPKENIKNMTREDFVKYHKEHYVASATTIVIAGGVDAKKTFKDIEKKFEAIAEGKKHPKKKVVEKQSRPAVAVEYKKTDQTHLLLAFRTVARKHKDTRALSLLGGILGAGMSSRLFERIREKMGVGYYVRAYHDTSTDHGVLEVATGIANERVAEVITAILEECKRMILEPVSISELNKIKEYTIGTMQMGIESSDEIAQFYGFQQLLGNEYKTPQEYINEIKKLTSGDVQRVAKKYFTKDRLNLAMIGPYKNTETFVKLLTKF
jgi:predicted Zn-dependent peptidase